MSRTLSPKTRGAQAPDRPNRGPPDRELVALRYLVCWPATPPALPRVLLFPFPVSWARRRRGRRGLFAETCLRFCPDGCFLHHCAVCVRECAHACIPTNVCGLSPWPFRAAVPRPQLTGCVLSAAPAVPGTPAFTAVDDGGEGSRVSSRGVTRVCPERKGSLGGACFPSAGGSFLQQRPRSPGTDAGVAWNKEHPRRHGFVKPGKHFNDS